MDLQGSSFSFFSSLMLLILWVCERISIPLKKCLWEMREGERGRVSRQSHRFFPLLVHYGSEFPKRPSPFSFCFFSPFPYFWPNLRSYHHKSGGSIFGEWQRPCLVKPLLSISQIWSDFEHASVESIDLSRTWPGLFFSHSSLSSFGWWLMMQLLRWFMPCAGTKLTRA